MPPIYLSEGSSAASSRLLSDPSTPETERDTLFDDQSLRADDEQYVLVTGGLGFIGSHTSLDLLKAGYNVIIVDDLSNSFRHVFDRILMAANLHFDSVGGQCPKAELCDMDYRDTPAMRVLLASHSAASPGSAKRRSNITGVIHFAAFKAVEESIRNPLKYYQNNVNGLVDFIDLLDGYNIKTFIFSSSATVYGTLAEGSRTLREEHCVHQKETYPGPDGGETHAEQGCTGITNPYGRTKFFGEAILADFAASDPSWTVVGLRYFNPIGCDASGLLGEDPKGIPSNLVPMVVKVLTGQYQELSVYGTDWDTPDGTAVRDFVHVTDVARGHTAALSAAQGGRIQGNFRTFNLGTGSGHSVTEAIAAMESVTQRPIPRRTVGRRAGDVGSCVATADRAALELGWKTEKSLRDACQDLWNHLTMGEP
jgi:UDP-glucose 4-epimerase